VKKAIKVILGAIVLSIVACLVVVGPLALIFPAYFPFCFYVYVFRPLLSYPLMFVAALLACVFGGYVLSHWPKKHLNYAVVPGAVMGLTMAWVTPTAWLDVR
jgi:ethanolamine transporter EutH